MDFCGYLKDQVYSTKVTSEQDLEDCIICAVEGIMLQMCEVAFQTLK
jgi:hypothetical protein